MKVKGQWMYLYRAADSEGNSINFHLSKTRDHKTADIEALKNEKKIPVGI